jgi:hypothetical protein
MFSCVSTFLGLYQSLYSYHIIHRLPQILRLALRLLLLNWVVLAEIEADTVDTVPLVRRRLIPLALEDVSQMPATITAHDLGPRHPKRTIGVSRDSTRDAVEVRWPSAARLELVGSFVEWGVAGYAGIDALVWHVLVVFASKGGFGTLFAEDAELFCRKRTC